MTTRLTSREIEIRVAHHFGYRTCVIVPNVAWGLFRDNHEADMVVLWPSGWADEVEIKVSASDIRADSKKRNGNGHARNPMMRKVWFAVPENLKQHPDIPEWAGVLSTPVDATYMLVYRCPKLSPKARKLSDAEQRKLLRLGCMRIWSLKSALVTAQQRSKSKEIQRG